MQLFLFKVNQIEIGDLQFAARGRPQLLAEFHNTIIVNIQPGNGEVTLGFFRLLLQADRATVGAEFHYSVALGIADTITKNAGSAVDGECFAIEVEFSIKYV